MTTYIAWKDFYSVGHAGLDADHKRIFRTINELYDAICQGNGGELIQPVLQRLVDYSLTHFEREERVMEEHGYPDLAEHRIKHDELRRRARGLAAEARLATSRDLLRFLKSWWTNHIQGEDKKYAPYLPMPVSP